MKNRELCAQIGRNRCCVGGLFKAKDHRVIYLRHLHAQNIMKTFLQSAFLVLNCPKLWWRCFRLRIFKKRATIRTFLNFWSPLESPNLRAWKHFFRSQFGKMLKSWKKRVFVAIILLAARLRIGPIRGFSWKIKFWMLQNTSFRRQIGRIHGIFRVFDSRGPAPRNESNIFHETSHFQTFYT